MTPKFPGKMEPRYLGCYKRKHLLTGCQNP